MSTGTSTIDIQQLPFPVAIFKKDKKKFSDSLAFHLSGFNKGFETVSNLEYSKFQALSEKEDHLLTRFFPSQNLLNGGNTLAGSLEHFSENDQKWYHVHFHQDEPATLFAFFTDITTHRKQIEKLKESNKNNLLLSDVTIEGILLHKQGWIIDLNLSLAKLLGYQKSEISGKHVFEFIHPKDHQLAKNNLGKDIATPYELTLLKSNNEEFIAEIQGHNIQWEEDIVRVAAVRDLTEKRRHDNHLR